MINVDKISLIEWIIGAGLFLFFCIVMWRLVRAANDDPITHEIHNFDLKNV